MILKIEGGGLFVSDITYVPWPDVREAILEIQGTDDLDEAALVDARERAAKSRPIIKRRVRP